MLLFRDSHIWHYYFHINIAISYLLRGGENTLLPFKIDYHLDAKIMRVARPRAIFAQGLIFRPAIKQLTSFSSYSISAAIYHYVQGDDAILYAIHGSFPPCSSYIYH